MAKMMFSDSKRMPGSLSVLGWVASMLMIAVVLMIAMYHQYFLGEIPCPLCLMQRVAFLGFAYGAMMQFIGKNCLRYVGISLFFVFVLMIISLRQSLLDICHTPGHNWVGSAIWHIHMPIWSFIFALGLLIFVACDLMLITREYKNNLYEYNLLKLIFNILAWTLIIISGITFISTFVQCGWYNCHTTGYVLLQ